MPNGCGQSCGTCENPESCDIANGRCKPAATGTLIFDGSFKSSDVWTRVTGGFGVYKGYNCLPQPDSLKVVPAASLPGGRTGYAGKFLIRPTSAYNCAGNQHDMLQTPGIGVPNPFRDVWYGWSQMLDSTWIPGDSVYSIGMALPSLSGDLPNRGFTIQMGGTDNYVTLLTNHQWFDEHSVAPYTFDVNHQINVWYDWMYHIKWERDNTGFAEVFLRRPGETDYTKIWSKYDYQTEYPFATASTNQIELRLGIYRSATTTLTAIFYVLNPKIGTTRAIVEY